MLGQELCRQLGERQRAFVPLDLDEVDIALPSSVAACRPLGEADIIFNAAAYTNVEGAEREWERAVAVNGEGVRHLARRARERGALLVHVSTDYVFDGQGSAPYPVDAPRRPLSAYGKSKLAGELALEETGGRTLLVRASWLYGWGGKNFVDTILKLAAERGCAEVVGDQLGSPTCTRDLARALIDLACGGREGVFHCANAGVASWLELAREALRLARIDVPIRALTTAESIAKFALRATRPAYSVLDLSRIEAALGRPMRPWREALAEYVAERQAAQRLPR